MKKLTVLGLIAICTTSAQVGAANNTSKAYKAAYQCAMESFTSGYGAGPTAFCLGNSRDPSSVEEKAYEDAESDFRKKAKSAPDSPNTCTFSYATYIANGSHADNFEEGLQRIDSMKIVARLMGSRDMSFFDKNNQQIPGATLSHWFKKKTPYEWTLTPEAMKTCSKKQIG